MRAHLCGETGVKTGTRIFPGISGNRGSFFGVENELSWSEIRDRVVSSRSRSISLSRIEIKIKIKIRIKIKIKIRKESQKEVFSLEIIKSVDDILVVQEHILSVEGGRFRSGLRVHVHFLHVHVHRFRSGLRVPPHVT